MKNQAELTLIGNHFGHESAIYLAAVACVETADKVACVHKVMSENEVRSVREVISADFTYCRLIEPALTNHVSKTRDLHDLRAILGELPENIDEAIHTVVMLIVQ